MQTFRQIIEKDDRWSVAYLINAKWAHPVWSQYMLMGFTLDDACVKYRSDVTHEIQLFALDPALHVEDSDLLVQKYHILTPANCGYQLTTTNELLIPALDRIVVNIEQMTMSPDTDFRYQWDHAFLNELGGVTLRLSAYEPAANAKVH